MNRIYESYPSIAKRPSTETPASSRCTKFEKYRFYTAEKTVMETQQHAGGRWEERRERGRGAE